jgi:hypothetical protein
MAGTGSTLFFVDCFEGSSELVGTGYTLFSGRLFSRQLRRIVLGLIFLDFFFALVLGSN